MLKLDWPDSVSWVDCPLPESNAPSFGALLSFYLLTSGRLPLCIGQVGLSSDPAQFGPEIGRDRETALIK